jgi:hypothetical protein
LEELRKKSAELKAQQEALREKEREIKAQVKKEESKIRAQKLAEALKNQKVSKRNLTQEVRECMLKGMTVDEMMETLKVERKAILDRKWLIEKKAEIR